MPRFRILILVGCCVLTSLARADDFGSLLANSPFAPAGPGTAAATDKSVEFRGLFTEKGATYFSIYDTATQRATWVGLNESGHPFVVRGYNQSNDSVTIELNGHNLNLGLKHAAVQLAAAPKPAPAATAAMQPNDLSPRERRFPNVNGPDGKPDPKRMEAFIEEMRRRRAARGQNGNGDMPGQAQGGSLPIPMNAPAPADASNPPAR